MGWTTRNFAIGTAIIEVPQALQFSQTYEEFGGVNTLRMADGSAVRQSNWSKLRTTLSGEGFVPPGLAGITWKTQQTLKCGIARAIQSSNNVIAIPAARRTDAGYEVKGYALKDGMWRPSPVEVVSNTATVTAVSGAVAYMVEYFPQFTAFIEAPQTDFNRTTGTFRWTINAEEI